MGESLATLLLFALTIGLAAPFVPFAAKLARRSVHNWKDAVLVAATSCALAYFTFAPASLLGVAVAYPITMVIVGPLLSLGGSNIGQGAIAFLFVWAGVWAVGVFCAACFATAQLNDWWKGQLRTDLKLIPLARIELPEFKIVAIFAIARGRKRPR